MTTTNIKAAKHSQGPKDAEGHTAGHVACPMCQATQLAEYRRQASDRGECSHCHGAGEVWVYNARAHEMVTFANGPATVTDAYGTRSLVTCICVRRGE